MNRTRRDLIIAAYGFEGLFELFAVDVVGGEIVGGDVVDTEVAHDDVGGGFGF